MTPDSTAHQGSAEATEAAVGSMSDTVRDTASDAIFGVENGSAIADGVEAAMQEGVRTAASASRATSDAIGAARERLDAMAATMPAPAQQLFRPFRSGGEALGKGLGASYATAMEGMAEFNSKAIAAWRSNAESTIRHWQGLAAVKSLSEAIALSAEHTRKQLEAVTVQTRELSALATRIVRDAADPTTLDRR